MSVKKYTVVGLYPEATTSFIRPRNGTFVHMVEANGPASAEVAASEWAAKNIDGEPGDIEILAIFEGECVDVYQE